MMRDRCRKMTTARMRKNSTRSHDGAKSMRRQVRMCKERARNMGIHMKRLLRFAISYPGWHTYGKDKSTVGAVKRCAALGLLEVNKHRQF